MLPAPVVAVNPSPESERMAIFKLDAYVLIIRGKDRVSFVDGLSTNKIEGDCSTVFTTTAAKVIDMADVIDMGDFLALIGMAHTKRTYSNIFRLGYWAKTSR